MEEQLINIFLETLTKIQSKEIMDSDGDRTHTIHMNNVAEILKEAHEKYIKLWKLTST